MDESTTPQIKASYTTTRHDLLHDHRPRRPLYFQRCPSPLYCDQIMSRHARLVGDCETTSRTCQKTYLTASCRLRKHAPRSLPRLVRQIAPRKRRRNPMIWLMPYRRPKVCNYDTVCQELDSLYSHSVFHCGKVTCESI